MFPWLICALCTTWSTVWCDLLPAASSNQASPLPPYTPVLPNQIKRENADSPKENECWTIKKQPQCCKPAMRLEDKTEQIPAVISKTAKEFPLQAFELDLWVKPHGLGWGCPCFGCVQRMWVTLPSVWPQTFSGPADQPESSYPKQPVNDSSPRLHTQVPQGRGILDGNLWIFWNLIKSRRLIGTAYGRDAETQVLS